MSTPILKRSIGDATFSAIGYGAMGIATGYKSPLPFEERMKVLDGVYASGITHWDTADAYQDSEHTIGEWFKRTGKRDEIFLATKFGFGRHWEGDETRIVNGDPKWAPKALQRSLEQLGVDYVDLWYLHRADVNVPIELTVRAMAEQVKAGKVKYLGLSESEKIGLLKTARELGVKVVVYAALGRGLLTGKYVTLNNPLTPSRLHRASAIRSSSSGRTSLSGHGSCGSGKGCTVREEVKTDPEQFSPTDFRRLIPRFSKENFPSILKITDGLKKIGEQYGASAGQVTLAWVLAQGEDIIPIVGTTKLDNLTENLGAYDVTLIPEDIAEVRHLADGASVPGDRYPPIIFQTLFVDTPALQE